MFARSSCICGPPTDMRETSAKLQRSMSRVGKLPSRRYSYTSIQLTRLPGAGNMPKPNPLAQGLNQARRSAAAAVAAPSDLAAVRTGSTGSRSGRVLVGGHFASQVQRALRIIAAEEGTTVQALLAEGINTVFAKRGKPEIAGLPTIRSV